MEDDVGEREAALLVALLDILVAELDDFTFLSFSRSFILGHQLRCGETASPFSAGFGDPTLLPTMLPDLDSLLIVSAECADAVSKFKLLSLVLSN